MYGDIPRDQFEHEMRRLERQFESRLHHAEMRGHQADRLLGELNDATSVACSALTELERQGTLDFLLIKNPTLRTWWEENRQGAK